MLEHEQPLVVVQMLVEAQTRRGARSERDAKTITDPLALRGVRAQSEPVQFVY
jgi:hypothetical protein